MPSFVLVPTPAVIETPVSNRLKMQPCSPRLGSDPNANGSMSIMLHPCVDGNNDVGFDSFWFILVRPAGQRKKFHRRSVFPRFR